MKKFRFVPKNEITNLPKNSGVYILRGGEKYPQRHCFRNKEILYIGKASNIKERVKNHFRQSAYRNNLFIDKAREIGYIKTDSEIETLILEANLIKKYQPKYNVVWRDDKNYFYVGITKEEFPRLFITHQIKAQSVKRKTQNHNLKLKTIYIGPFVDGKSLKQTLKILRKAFPYRTCKTLPKRPCLWYQLGRCPAPCLLKSSLGKQLDRFTKSINWKKEYRRNIQNLMKILQGSKIQVLKDLKREMKRVSGNQDYEEAAKFRDQIESLEKILENARIFSPTETTVKYCHDLGFTVVWRETKKELKKILRSKKGVSRIEAYDISNIQGQEATGSMVVFTNGRPDKSQYRKFKIKIAGNPNDIAMIKEVLKRRLKHLEWPYPDLILIDGGKAQLNATLQCLMPGVKHIKIVALAKKENKLYIENRNKPILLKKLPREIFNLILQLRDEAHRFALSYHRKLRQKALFKK